MKKQMFSLLLLICVALSLLYGCGASGGTATSDTATDSTASSEGWEGASPQKSNGAQAAGATESPQSSAIRENAKLIMTAEVYGETRDFVAADAAVQNLTTQYGGYLETHATAGAEGERSANYTARVPQKNFEAFLKAVGNTCNIVSQSQNAEDVGQAYYDTETHLKTLKTKHERLLVLLAKSEKMEDIIQLENALSDTEYQIEQYSTTLRRYDDLIDFSTIRIQFNEVRDLTAVSQGNSFLSDVQRAAVAGTRGALIVIKGFILFVIVIWPLLLIAVAVLALLLAMRRRRRTKIPAKPDSPRLPTDSGGDTPES